MIPTEYFERPDTPMLNSPIGTAMCRVSELYPDLSAAECYLRAKDAYSTAARHRTFAVSILSPEQVIKNQANLAALRKAA